MGMGMGIGQRTTPTDFPITVKTHALPYCGEKKKNPGVFFARNPKV